MATMSTCTLHPEREAKQAAVGHLLCDDCFNRYRGERCSGGLGDRPFMQQILREGYELDADSGRC